MEEAFAAKQSNVSGKYNACRIGRLFYESYMRHIAERPEDRELFEVNGKKRLTQTKKESVCSALLLPDEIIGYLD